MRSRSRTTARVAVMGSRNRLGARSSRVNPRAPEPRACSPRADTPLVITAPARTIPVINTREDTRVSSTPLPGHPPGLGYDAALMFSDRTRFDLRPNRLAARLAERRAAGAKLIDLTQSNPTHAALPHAAELLAPLAAEA